MRFEKKNFFYYSPARFLLGRKKRACKKPCLLFRPFWHTLLVDSEISFLFLLCRGMWIVNRIMQSATLFPFHCLTGDQIPDVNHVTQFAKLA